ncbi:MAG: hypothetical protein EOO14_07380, partial [Chitinophagaceae bacterium]
MTAVVGVEARGGLRWPTNNTRDTFYLSSSMSAIITSYPHFFTATCLEWKKLLAPDKYKNILIDSLRFLVKDERVMVYGFVIMPNHIHVVWHLKAGRKRPDVQRDFLKF